MATARWRKPALAVVFVLLASCAAPRLRPDAQRMSAQEIRERTLAAQPRWTLRGRLAISGPQDGGSGSLEWSQDGGSFRFTVNAPVTGKTWTLSGNDSHVELEGLRDGPIVGDNAAIMLERELGWQVPVDELAHWVRATRAPGDAELVFRADGLPAELRQAGWKVEYPDYDASRQPALPRRIFASRGDYKVRLVVQRWELR